MVQSRFIIALPALFSTCSVQFLSVSFCPSKKKGKPYENKTSIVLYGTKNIFKIILLRATA